MAIFFAGGGRPHAPVRALFKARAGSSVQLVEPPTLRKLAGWLSHMN